MRSHLRTFLRFLHCSFCRTSSTVHSMVAKRLCTDKMARTSRTATNSTYRNTPILIWKELLPSVLLFVGACGKAGNRWEISTSFRTQRYRADKNAKFDPRCKMLGAKKQRFSEEFWSRKDIVSCQCSSLP